MNRNDLSAISCLLQSFALAFGAGFSLFAGNWIAAAVLFAMAAIADLLSKRAVDRNVERLERLEGSK